jgi:RHS repeat-associated protein
VTSVPRTPYGLDQRLHLRAKWNAIRAGQFVRWHDPLPRQRRTRLSAGRREFGGSLTASTSYDAWGNPETSGGLTAYTPIGFAGGYTDATNLVYFINRYYDPTTGVFVSVDPLVDETGQTYSYANDDPTGAVDPDGLDCGIFSFACATYDATAGAVKGAGHYVATHKVAAGIVLGVIGVATGGAGFFVEGAAATALSATAVASGGAAAYFDTGPCLHGNHAACAGAVLGWTSALAGVPATIGLALGVDTASVSGAVVLRLIPALAFNIGFAGLTSDFGLWISNEMESGCLFNGI